MRLLFNRPLLSALLAFILSALLTSKLLFEGSSAGVYIAVLLVLSLASLFLCYKNKAKISSKLFTISLCLIFALTASVILFGFLKTRLTIPQNLKTEGTEIKATVNEIVVNEDGYVLLNAVAKEVGGDKCNYKFAFEIYGNPKLEVGDIFSCVGDIESISDVSKQEANYLFADGCAGSVYNIDDVSFIEKSKNSVFVFSKLSSFIANRIESNIRGDSGALMSALLLGKTNSLDAFITRDFNLIGILHMLALSGMHLTLLMSAIQFFLTFADMRKKYKTLILISITLFYVALSGFCLSMLRAAFMFFLTSFSFLTRRETDPYTSLFIAVSIIFILSPASVLDIGLWLSFFGTFSILVYFEAIEKNRKSGDKSLGRAIISYIVASFVISIFAMIFTLPITALIFGEISVISPISNILFSPLFDLELILAFLAPFLCKLNFFSAFCELIGNFIIKLAAYIANLDFIYVSTSFTLFYVLAIIFFIYVIYLLCRNLRETSIIPRLFAPFALLIIALFICQFSTYNDTFLIYEQNGRSSRNEILFFAHKGESTVIDISNHSSTSFNSIIELNGEEHFTKISNYVLTSYSPDLDKRLEKANSKIKIKRIFLPYPTDYEEAIYALNTVEMLERRKISYEFYKTDSIIQLGEIKYIFYTGDNFSDKSKYVLAFKLKEDKIFYISSYMAIHPLTITDASVSILGCHDGVHEAFISADFLKNTDRFVISNPNFIFENDTFTDIPEETDIRISKYVKIPID